MTIFSHFGIKTRIELALLVIVLVLLAMVLAMFFITAVIRETAAGCKKIPYGPGHEGKCGDGYFVVSILDSFGILRNPEAAPTAGYMICCRTAK